MASEQEQGIDRRRMLGVIGKASAVAAAVGIPVGVVGTRAMRAKRVDLARVQREVEAGPDGVPLDELLPDGISGDDFAASADALRYRVNAVARLLLDSGRASRSQLVTGKHAMHAAERELEAILAGVADGSIAGGQARSRARAMFATYFAEMKSLGLAAA